MTDINTLLEHWGTDALDTAAENVLKDWHEMQEQNLGNPNWMEISEAEELLQIMAHRERQYKELLNRKHPVYEFATLTISRWEYQRGESDVIISTTFAVWSPSEEVGDIDPSYNSVKDFEFALSKASAEGWEIRNERVIVDSTGENLTRSYLLQREKL